MKNHFKKLILFGLFGILLGSCSENDPAIQVEYPVLTSLQMTEDVAMAISYEMRTSTFLTTLKSQDKENMTRAEKALSIPKPVGLRVTQMIKKDGKIDADIEMVQFDDLPVFPKNMIGNISIPSKFDTKIIEIRDGASTHYNEDREVITNKVQSESETRFLEQVMADVRESTPIPDDQMDMVIEAFRESGFDIEQSQTNPDILRLIVMNVDGSRVEVLLDTNLQLIRGRNNYSSEGELETSSHFMFDQLTRKIKGHWFSTYYTSPFTGNQMMLNKVSKIDNLIIQVNQ